MTGEIVIIDSAEADDAPFVDDDSYDPADYADEGSDLTVADVEEHAADDSDYDPSEYVDG